jgi:hypothetical protein
MRGFRNPWCGRVWFYCKCAALASPRFCTRYSKTKNKSQFICHKSINIDCITGVSTTFCFLSGIRAPVVFEIEKPLPDSGVKPESRSLIFIFALYKCIQFVYGYMKSCNILLYRGCIFCTILCTDECDLVLTSWDASCRRRVAAL